ncbi:MAG: hypothetical protein QM802_09785 [Agriterribacter sp.]
MRIRNAIAISFLVGTFYSCQKELSVENGNNRVQGLLIKAVGVTGSDTLTTVYTYDNLSRLQTEVSEGKSGGEQIYQYIRYTRDFTTRITDITQQLTHAGVVYDTTRTHIHYPDPIAFEYDYSVSTFSYSGYAGFDSTNYEFSDSLMNTNETYTSIPDLGIPPTLSERNVFTYGADKTLQSRDLYSSVSSPDGSLLFTTTFNYTYGGGADYLWYTTNAAQNYLLVGIPNSVNKNVSRLEIVDQTGTSQDITILTTLDAGADTKPTSGTVSVNPLNRITKYTFYYQ